MGFEQKMEIYDSILLILTDVTGFLTAYFDGPQGTLQALAFAGVVVILLLFIISRRHGQASQRSVASTVEPVMLNELAAKAELSGESAPVKRSGNGEADAFAAVAAERGTEDAESLADEEKTGTNVGGFVFHRRKAKNTVATAPIDDADQELALAAIEQEMLATRQLYLDGVISKDVYVAETRNLYSKALQKT